jgi:hypothetical protein
MCYGQILESGLRKTRKQTRCDDCKKLIPVGELRARVVGVDDGEFVANNYCLRCEALAKLASVESQGECWVGSVRDQFRDTGHGSWRDLRKRLRTTIANMLEKHAASRVIRR